MARVRWLERGAASVEEFELASQRADVLFDLVHMAMACDPSRVAAVRMTFDQCFMNMPPLFDVQADVHDSSHGAAPHDSFADAVG